MKYLYLHSFFVLFSFSLETCAQKNIYSCEEINSIIVDVSIFEQLPNKSFILNKNIAKHNVYVIKTEKVNYYASEVLMKDIKKSISKFNCDGIIIKKLKKSDYDKIKIIRDKN